jgi:hypothetical protein
VRLVTEVEEERLQATPLLEDLIERMTDRPLCVCDMHAIFDQPSKPAGRATDAEQEARGGCITEANATCIDRGSHVPEAGDIALERDPIEVGRLGHADIQELEGYPDEAGEVFPDSPGAHACPVDRDRPIVPLGRSDSDQVPAECVMVAEAAGKSIEAGEELVAIPPLAPDPGDVIV